MRRINPQASSIHHSLKQSGTAPRPFIAGIRWAALTLTALFLSATVASAQSRFDTQRVNEPVVKEFQNAWRMAGSGAKEIEAVVLIFKMADGSYRADSLGTTNERQQSTFPWNPAAITIVHTHPNACSARPAWADKDIADKYHVPILTITSRGMFMYDPETKQVSKVQDGLDWLQLDKWARNPLVAQAEAAAPSVSISMNLRAAALKIFPLR